FLARHTQADGELRLAIRVLVALDNYPQQPGGLQQIYRSINLRACEPLGLLRSRNALWKGCPTDSWVSAKPVYRRQERLRAAPGDRLPSNPEYGRARWCRHLLRRQLRDIYRGGRNRTFRIHDLERCYWKRNHSSVSVLRCFSCASDHRACGTKPYQAPVI